MRNCYCFHGLHSVSPRPWSFLMPINVSSAAIGGLFQLKFNSVYRNFSSNNDKDPNEGDFKTPVKSYDWIFDSSFIKTKRSLIEIRGKCNNVLLNTNSSIHEKKLAIDILININNSSTLYTWFYYTFLPNVNNIIPNEIYYSCIKDLKETKFIINYLKELSLISKEIKFIKVEDEKLVNTNSIIYIDWLNRNLNYYIKNYIMNLLYLLYTANLRHTLHITPIKIGDDTVNIVIHKLFNEKSGNINIYLDKTAYTVRNSITLEKKSDYSN